MREMVCKSFNLLQYTCSRRRRFCCSHLRETVLKLKYFDEPFLWVEEGYGFACFCDL